MFKNYFKIAFRNFRKYKTYSFINISGLAIGVAGTLLILMYVANELSYENFHINRKRIYRVAVDFGQGGSKLRLPGAMEALAPAVVEQVPEVEEAVRFQWDSSAKLEYEHKKFQEKRFFFVDPKVFDVFSFQLVKADGSGVFDEPFAMVISENMVKKYFADADPLGKIILYNHKFPLKITGVMKDIPTNTHLYADFLVSYASLEKMGKNAQQPWTSVGEVYTYLLLNENTSIERLSGKLNEILKTNTSESFSKIIAFNLLNLSDIYMESDTIVDLGARGSMANVYVLSAVALLVLSIASFNFMNLSTARSLNRMKEVGARKVFGANRTQLIGQFLGESLITASLAILFALVLFELFYPALNVFLENSLAVSQQNFKYLCWMIPFMVFIVGIVAGIYPAFFLSKYKPVDTLSNRVLSGFKRSRFRTVLVIAQFSLSIILIASTIVLFRQIDFMKNSELGFDKKDVILIPRRSLEAQAQEKYAVFKERLLQIPGVVSVAGAYTVPGVNSKETKIVQKKGALPDDRLSLQAIAVDFDYVTTMRLHIVQGRDFAKEYASDGEKGILLNQAAVEHLQLAEAVGTKLMISVSESAKMQEVTVLGVIRDFHVKSLQEKIEPLLLYIEPKYFYNIAVRIRPRSAASTLTQIESTWNQIFPDGNFQYQFLEEVYDRLYRTEEKMSQLLSLFSFFAIFVACLGLFGLVSFTTERRNKEIGIRKVVGASVAGVVFLLTKDFTRWVLLANLIAWPLAWYAMNKWLQNFAYRIEISWWIFALAGGMALVIALVTVSTQAIKAALTNPVESLRYE